MPFKGQFAFISTEEVSPSQLSRVAAHELGHGTFRLYHTFSDKNDYIVPQGTTDNLMDYNNGKELHKYQWDLVQDPQGMWFTGLIDEEEMAMVSEEDSLVTTITSVENAQLAPKDGHHLNVEFEVENYQELIEKYPDETQFIMALVYDKDNNCIYTQELETDENNGSFSWNGIYETEQGEQDTINSEKAPYKLFIKGYCGKDPSSVEDLSCGYLGDNACLIKNLILHTQSTIETLKSAFTDSVLVVTDSVLVVTDEDSTENGVDKTWEEWNNFEDMQVYASNSYEQYELMCNKYENAFDVFKDKTPMEYFSENLKEITFFGNTIKVHNDFASILTQVDSNLSGTNVGAISISQPFQMRSIYGKSSTISQHGLGLALDINVKFNPFITSDRTSVRYLIKRSTNLDCDNITDYSIEQIIEASNLFKQTFENSGFEIIKASLEEISLYENDNNVSINSLKDDVIYDSLNEFVNSYNQILTDTSKNQATELIELKNNIEKFRES